MIEPEICFATIHDDMDCAEDYLKFCLKYVIKNNMDDLKFFEEYEARTAKEKNQKVQTSLINRLQTVINTPFQRVEYTEAIKILEENIKKKKAKFEFKVEWGIDLASEHEKFLTDKVFNGPIIVYNYPKDIKAFYMKMNED